MSDLSISTPSLEASPTALELALHYAAEGFAVFPIFPIHTPAPADVVAAFNAGTLSKKEAQAHAVCSCGSTSCTSPGKHPITNDGVDAATLDVDRIREWFTEGPDANVGIRMPAGTFAIDFDFYVAGARERYDALVAAGLPPTLEQKSGANGLHCIYSGAPEGFTYAGYFDEIAGVDVIHHAHRYLVAEPSNHWTGGVYEWANGLPIATAPAWLLERCKRGVGRKQKTTRIKTTQAKPRSADGVSMGARLLEAHANRSILFTQKRPHNVAVEVWAITQALTMAPAISADEEGSTEPGHVTLSRAACALIALGLTNDQALDVLWAHYNPRCVPPWTEDDRTDFERTVRAAGRDITASDTAAQSVSGGEPVAAFDVDVDPLAAFGRILDPTVPVEPLHFFCKDYDIAVGKLTMLSGYAGGGKSMLALQLGICTAAGIPFLGAAVAQRPVILLAFEGHYLTENRWERFCRALGVDRATIPLEVVLMSQKYSVEFFNALQEKLKRAYDKMGVAPAFIIDTVTSSLRGGADQNSADYAAPLWDLGLLSEEYRTLGLVAAHDNKSASQDDPLHGISGHNAIPSTIQTHIQISHNASTPEMFDLVCGRGPMGGFKARKGQWVDVAEPGASHLTGAKWGLKGELIAEGDAKAAVGMSEPERIARDLLAVVARCTDPYGEKREELLAQVLGTATKKRAELDRLASKGLVKPTKHGNGLRYTLGSKGG